MDSFLVSEMSEHGIEDEDWVVLSPDMTINVNVSPGYVLQHAHKKE